MVYEGKKELKGELEWLLNLPPPPPPDIFAQVDTSWFDKNPEEYLEREDFKLFQELARVDLRDLLSDNPDVVFRAQEKIVSQTKIFAEVRNEHSGYCMPLLYYTHDFNFGAPILAHNLEVEEMAVAMEMGDSLRKRHIALSHAILPMVVNDVSARMNRPIVMKNLGSGVGLDTLHAASKVDGRISALLNYETNSEALALGQQIASHMEAKKQIETDKVQFVQNSFTKSSERADIIVKIGVICGLQDAVAQTLISSDYRQLNEGGVLVLSSSNENMKSRAPLGSFLIQHIGSKASPMKSWGLNCRTKETMFNILSNAGFSKITIYDDSNFPGKEKLLDDVLNGVDTLPSTVLEYEHSGRPIRLPTSDTPDQDIGYNWIAVATK